MPSIPLRRPFPFVLAGGLLAAACGSPPPVAPVRYAAAVAQAPPAPELTICERPGEPMTPARDAAVGDSFRTFGRSWIERMQTVTEAKGALGARKRIGDAFETELRETSNARAPYVGVLRYCEYALRCSGEAEATCSPSQSTVVTELFRYQGGEWIY